MSPVQSLWEIESGCRHLCFSVFLSAWENLASVFRHAVDSIFVPWQDSARKWPVNLGIFQLLIHGIESLFYYSIMQQLVFAYYTL